MRAHRPAALVNRPLTRAIDRVREARWITRRTLLIGGYFFAAVVLFFLVLDVRISTTNGLSGPDKQPLAFDFVKYFAGAKAVVTGQGQLVYDHTWFYALERSIVGPDTNAELYSYPPITLILSTPLALFSYIPALIVWTSLGAGLAFVLLLRMVGWQEAALAVVGTPAAFHNFANGQNGYFNAALLAGGLMMLQRRPVLAGICFGCLAYKPHLGLLLPAALAAGGHWRAFGAAAATVAALVLASVVLFGAAAWIGFLDDMAVIRSLIEPRVPHLATYPTVLVLAREFGATPALAYAVQMISSVLALTAIVIVWHRPGPSEIKAASLVVGMFLATPYVWDYDTVVLIFAAAWLGCEGMRTGFLPWERIAVVLLLTFALWADGSAKLWGVQSGPVILWLVLLVLMRRAVGPVAAPAVLAEA